MLFGEIMAEFDHVDDPDVLERMETRSALRAALNMIRPENWWGTGLNPKVLFAIARDDGIPVVWVPQSAILLELATASDRNARMSILHTQKREIIDHCKRIIRLCGDPWITNEYALTGKAFAAYEDGHVEAAMALAVSVSEPLAIWASTPRVQFFKSEAEQEAWKKRRGNRKYEWATLELSAAEADLSQDKWFYKSLIAPIERFFTKWFPDSGYNPPDSLSRHVVAHQPTQEHFSSENALLSLMLTTSLLYAVQEWSEQVRWMDDEI